MFCKSCGNKIEEGTLFCDNCGFAVTNIAVNLQQNDDFLKKPPKNMVSSKIKFIILGLVLTLMVLIAVCYFVLRTPSQQKGYNQDNPEELISEFVDAINTGNADKSRLLLFDKYAADEVEYMMQKQQNLYFDAADIVMLPSIYNGIGKYLEDAYREFGDDFSVEIDIIEEETVDIDTKHSISEGMLSFGVEPEDIRIFECEVTKKGSLNSGASYVEIYCYELDEKWYICCLEYDGIREIFRN